MEQHTTHTLPEALLQAQLRHYNSQTKKILWESDYISQDDAAFLLGITKETLRARALNYKAVREGNKIYYSPKQIKEALSMEASQRSIIQDGIASAYDNLIKINKS